jgi:DnaJ-class molecular chaperone
MARCSHCGGSKRESCEECGGSGYVRWDEETDLGSPDAFGGKEVPCGVCHGRGTVPCSECG